MKNTINSNIDETMINAFGNSTEGIFETVSKDKFYDFLKSNQSMVRVAGANKEDADIFIKIPIANEIDLLYHQRNYNLYNAEEKYVLKYDKKLECVGIWNHVTQTLYESAYFLGDILQANQPYVERVTKEEIEELLRTQLKETIMSYVAENYDMLKQSVTEQMKEQYHAYTDNEIEYAFIYDHDTELKRFIPNVSVSLNATTLIDYARDGLSRSNLLGNMLNQYFDKQKQKLGVCILNYEDVNKRLNAIKNNPEDPLHKAKQIIKTIKDTDCQTVNVTISKNNILFTFKTEADALKNFNQYVSTYKMNAQDRRQFEQLFGRNEDYSFYDIVKITYGKKVLYEDKSIQ
jgi:hypothetical protein